MKQINQNEIALLVGDNPFHNISHLSQERTRLRERAIVLPERAADLIHFAVENGANGFMFSVSETTLAILKVLRERREIERIGLYAIVPYAYEYVKLSTQVGGIPGLAKKVAKQIVYSGNLKAMSTGLIGFIMTDPVRLLKTYLSYEISRIRSFAGKKARIESVLLHEVVTDLALATDMDWLFKAHVDYALKIGLTPGFNTCNFVRLLSKLEDLETSPGNVTIASPFNKVGFQMSPSKRECEQALKSLSAPTLIPISILAAGYLRPLEAIEYIATLPNIKGVVAGVSKNAQASETFRLMREKLKA